MKNMILVLIAFIGFKANAQLESIECRKEILARGLTTIIQEVTLDVVSGSSFEVASLRQADWSDAAYLVDVVIKDQNSKSDLNYTVVVERTNDKNCTLESRLEQ